MESLTNPLVQVADLEAVVAFARERGLITVIDNTFASPVNFRPAELGFDLVMESATKYLNGHTDICAGVVAGSEEQVWDIKVTLDHLGGVLDSHACFLLERGSEDPPHPGAGAERFRPPHRRVPGRSSRGGESQLPRPASHAQHERAARLFDGFRRDARPSS